MLLPTAAQEPRTEKNRALKVPGVSSTRKSPWQILAGSQRTPSNRLSEGLGVHGPPTQNFCRNLRTRSRSRTRSVSSLSQMM